ncbi:hypothetical protein NHX12_014801, partial [Muraenolepis orangiensis]
MEEQPGDGDPVEQNHSLSVVLPSGLQQTAVVHGSKPVMDVLVMLCARYRLNPSNHTVEVLTLNRNTVSFKPNSPIGSLEAHTVVLKLRGAGDRTRRPYVPEATVRLLVNYRRSHKTVVRVNPRVPLGDLVPAIGQKCEFRPESTVLLRDSAALEPLDLTRSLNDLGIRELYAKDTAGPVEDQQSPRKDKKRQENNGFLSLFRRKKDKDGRVFNGSVSQDLKEPLAVCASPTEVCSANAPAADTPKKRPAPRPPTTASRSVPHDRLRGLTSADSTLRRAKRRAPPPPSAANSHGRRPADTGESAEPAWEDPTRRKGMTTFTVVPSSKQRRYPEVDQGGPAVPPGGRNLPPRGDTGAGEDRPGDSDREIQSSAASDSSSSDEVVRGDDEAEAGGDSRTEATTTADGAPALHGREVDQPSPEPGSWMAQEDGERRGRRRKVVMGIKEEIQVQDNEGEGDVEEVRDEEVHDMKVKEAYKEEVKDEGVKVEGAQNEEIQKKEEKEYDG